MLIDNTPIDYLDFASPQAGLGRKTGIDATHAKWRAKVQCAEWGRTASMDHRSRGAEWIGSGRVARSAART